MYSFIIYNRISLHGQHMPQSLAWIHVILLHVTFRNSEYRGQLITYRCIPYILCLHK